MTAWLRAGNGSKPTGESVLIRIGPGLLAFSVGHSGVWIQADAVRSGFDTVKAEQGAVKLPIAKSLGEY